MNNEYRGQNHIMLDIETLSKTNYPVIPQISAVQFCPATGETFAEFDIRIDLYSAEKAGMELDVSTVLWWLEQSKEAQEKVFFSSDQRIDIKLALAQFKTFAESCSNTSEYSDVRIWGNGPTFDLVKLRNNFERCGMKHPWDFYNERCVRTLSAFNPKFKKELPFHGIRHDGLADCKHQINYISSNFEQLFEQYETN